MDLKQLKVCTVIGGCLLVIGLAQPTPGMADTAAGLQTIDKSLRTAERNMFGGRGDQAFASLEEIGRQLEELKKSDPGNAKIDQTEKKYLKLVGDLERRTGKKLGGDATGTPSATARALGAVKSGATGEVKMPHDAKHPFDKASRGVTNIESLFGQLDDPNYPGDRAQLVSRIEQTVAEIKRNLAEARELAAAKGVTSHPSFDEVEARLATLTSRSGQAKGAFKQQQQQARARAEAVTADVARLKEEFDRLNPILGAATGTVIYYNDLEPVRKLLAQLQDFQINDREKLVAKLGDFAGKYGTSREGIDAKASAMGYAGVSSSASYHYLELAAGMKKIAKTGPVMAEDLAAKAKALVDGIGKINDFYKMDQYEKARQYLVLAHQFDPANLRVKELDAVVDRGIASGMAVFGAKIDQQKWPKQATDAPSGSGALARVARQWFKNSPDWGSRPEKPYTILGVVITGPWSVQKTDLLGQPIMYGLPVAVAVQKGDDAKNNLARVFSLTLRTREMSGVKMEPPFVYATVGGSYYIRPGAL